MGIFYLLTDEMEKFIFNSISGSNSAVECQLPKLDGAGSNPVSRSLFSRNFLNQTPLILEFGF